MSRWHWQKTLTLLMVSVLLFLMTGCQQYWYQPSKTFDQCKQDKALCLAELNKLSGDSQSFSYRISFIEKYMKDRGYQPTMEYALPMDVKRADSESEQYMLIRGVAGRIQ